MMTAGQFAYAIRADLKWVHNAARILGQSFEYNVDEARWLGLVHQLHAEQGIPLSRAADLARTALSAPTSEREVRVGGDGTTAVLVDVARYRAVFAAALSTALNRETPRRRGRPRRPRGRRTGARVLRAAQEHGVDLSLLEQSLALTPSERIARLDANREFITALRKVGTQRHP